MSQSSFQGSVEKNTEKMFIVHLVNLSSLPPAWVSQKCATVYLPDEYVSSGVDRLPGRGVHASLHDEGDLDDDPLHGSQVEQDGDRGAHEDDGWQDLKVNNKNIYTCTITISSSSSSSLFNDESAPYGLFIVR